MRRVWLNDAWLRTDTSQDPDTKQSQAVLVDDADIERWKKLVDDWRWGDKEFTWEYADKGTVLMNELRKILEACE